MPSRREFLGAVGVGSLGALAGCSSDGDISGDWHRAGYDERWRATGRGTQPCRRIAAAKNRVYYTEGLRNLVALNAATGDEAWRRHSSSGFELSTPAVTERRCTPE